MEHGQPTPWVPALDCCAPRELLIPADPTCLSRAPAYFEALGQAVQASAAQACGGDAGALLAQALANAPAAITQAGKLRCWEPLAVRNLRALECSWLGCQACMQSPVAAARHAACRGACISCLTPQHDPLCHTCRLGCPAVAPQEAALTASPNGAQQAVNLAAEVGARRGSVVTSSCTARTCCW